jgi:hypothetical protein
VAVSGPARAGEDGQLLILLAGLVVMVLMVLALGWDTSNWLIGRRALNDAADGAAVAAASDLDVGGYYASGGRRLALAEATARTTVAEYAAGSGVERLVATATVTSDGGGRPLVTVHASAPAASVFLQYVGVVPPRMEAAATATVRRLPPAPAGRRPSSLAGAVFVGLRMARRRRVRRLGGLVDYVPRLRMARR